MTVHTNSKDNKSEESKHTDLFDMPRKFFLAGLGAAYEMSDSFERLAERGKEHEPELRRRIREKAARPELIATKADIAALNTRINEMMKAIEDLKNK